MPTHSYRTDRRPPTALDHVLAHTFELAISAWAIIGGLLAVVAAFNGVTTVSPSLDRLPAVLAGAVGVLLVTGGGGILHGLLDNSEDLMVGFRRERMGLVLKAAGWASYGVAIGWIAPASVLSWSLSLFMVAACLLRIEATRRSEARYRRVMPDGF